MKIDKNLEPETLAKPAISALQDIDAQDIDTPKLDATDINPHAFVSDRTQAKERDILGNRVKNLKWDGAFNLVERDIFHSNEQHIYAFLNANNANLSMQDEEYRNSLKNAKVLPDGIGVDIAAKVMSGKPFLANLNGTDFIPGLMVHIEKPLNVALIGATLDVVIRARDNFHRSTPWHKFTVISDGYFGEEGTPDVLRKLEELQPDIVLIGMGSPLQEKWVENNIGPEHGKVIFTVGALFDFVSKKIPRAPLFVRQMRLEWVFRVLCEPRRLWRRYVFGNPRFLMHVLRQKIAKMRGRKTSR